jgi:hypothetical protein
MVQLRTTRRGGISNVTHENKLRYIREFDTPLNRGTRAVDEVKMLQQGRVEIPAIKLHDLYTVPQAVEYLGISERSLRRYHARGVLTALVFANRRKMYLFPHLWVFKRLWLNKDDNQENTA